MYYFITFWIGVSCGFMVLILGFFIGSFLRNQRCPVPDQKWGDLFILVNDDDPTPIDDGSGGNDPIDIQVDDAISGHICNGPRRRSGGTKPS